MTAISAPDQPWVTSETKHGGSAGSRMLTPTENRAINARAVADARELAVEEPAIKARVMADEYSTGEEFH